METATVKRMLAAASRSVAGSFDRNVSSTSLPDTKLLPMSPVIILPSHEKYWTRNGRSSPSRARAASKVSCDTAAPTPEYISVIASLPASRIRANERNVIPKSTGTKDKKRCRT